MNENLKNQLCEYLGQLMYQHENEFDWVSKDSIAEKINAVNKLLDIDKHEKSWYEKIAIKLKNNS